MRKERKSTKSTGGALEIASVSDLTKSTDSNKFQVFQFVQDQWESTNTLANAGMLKEVGEIVERQLSLVKKQDSSKIEPVRSSFLARPLRVTSTLGLIQARISVSNINDYPKQDIQRACYLSEFAYHSPEALTPDRRFAQVKSALADGFPQCIQGCEPHNPQAILWGFKDTDDLYISFRGNHNPETVLAHLGLFEREEGPEVFGSYLSDFKALAPLLITLIDQNRKKNGRVIITGHGLGGGLATLASPFVAEIFPDVAVDCITFGAPKIGASIFSDFYSARVRTSVRVIHSGDPLPYLPTSSTLCHFTDGLCITRAGFCESWEARSTASPQVQYGIEKIDFDAWSWEQSAAKYRRRVNAAVKLGLAGSVFKKYTVTPSRLDTRGA